MNFNQALISVCCGTKGFPKLMRTPSYKALLHLLMLIFLSSFIIVLCRYPNANRQIGEIVKNLDHNLGKVDISHEGVRVEKNPEVNRSFNISDEIFLDYSPQIDGIAKGIGTHTRQLYGIVWCPSMILYCVKLDEGEFYVLPMLSSVNVVPPGNYMKSEDIQKFVSENSSKKGDYRLAFSHAPLKQGNFSFFEIEDSILAAYLLVIFLKYTSIMFAMSFFYSLIFALIFQIGASKDNQLTFSKMLVVAIYTGFPGILIGMVFPAFNISVMDFQTVFLFSFTVYLFAVLGRLKKPFEPPKSENPSS